jgi:ABC-type dipeptide/oligopeptide/nickel transport system permease component
VGLPAPSAMFSGIEIVALPVFTLMTMKWPVRQRQIPPSSSSFTSKPFVGTSDCSGIHDRRALAQSTIRARLAQVGFRR